MANDPKTLPEGLKKDTTTGMGANIKKLKQQGKQQDRGPQGRGKKKKDFFIVLDDTFIKDPDKIIEKIMITDPEKKAKGGRVGYKSGTRGCKLAMKGKGRAYGKNS